MVRVARASQRFRFPRILRPDPTGLVALGGELSVPLVIEAYSRGIFPWSGEDPIPWCAPDPRSILAPERFAASRSLRKLARSARYRVAFDVDFAAVIRACADTPRPGQPGTWITPNLVACYEELHALGVAHSVEVRAEGALVGGLYGLTFGRAFFGESMFHRARDTSKLALMTLCGQLSERGFHFVDCQAVTPHLMSLGAEAIPLRAYLKLLSVALAYPSAHRSWRDWKS